MDQVTCSVEGCNATYKLRLGLCVPHYSRKRRTGDVRPDIPVAPPRQPGLYEKPEWCRAKYCDELLTIAEMADAAGCSVATIVKWMKRHGIAAQRPHQRAALRGNALTGERNPMFTGARICSCGRRKHGAANCCRLCRDQEGPNNPNWTGEAVGYEAAHDRVRSVLGRASDYPCGHCATSAEHWAYDHADPHEKRDDRGLVYSPNPDHYMPLCVPCHRRFDKDFRGRAVSARPEE